MIFSHYVFQSRELHHNYIKWSFSYLKEWLMASIVDSYLQPYEGFPFQLSQIGFCQSSLPLELCSENTLNIIHNQFGHFGFIDKVTKDKICFPCDIICVFVKENQELLPKFPCHMKLEFGYSKLIVNNLQSFFILV